MRRIGIAAGGRPYVIARVADRVASEDVVNADPRAMQVTIAAQLPVGRRKETITQTLFTACAPKAGAV